MYGLVNNSLRGFITKNGGLEVWENVVRISGVGVSEFDAMKTYPDDMTYKLVGAACETMQTNAPDLLFGFGVHWMEETGPNHYGEFLEMCGTDFAGFLGNLDAMHSRIQSLFPALDPPSFSVKEVKEDSLVLEYMTERPGLEYFVRGLIEGVARKTGVEVVVEEVRQLGTSPHGLIFQLSYAE